MRHQRIIGRFLGLVACITAVVVAILSVQACSFVTRLMLSGSVMDAINGNTMPAETASSLLHPSVAASCLQALSEGGHWACDDGNDSQWMMNQDAQVACRMRQQVFRAKNIEVMLHGKWLMIIGDSSARLLFDYATARLSGGGWLHEGRWWPSDRNQFALRHSIDCHLSQTSCYYDGFIGGARMTFVWHTHAAHSAPQIKETIYERILARSVGWPDYVILENGPWDYAESNHSLYPFATHGWSKVQEKMIQRVTNCFNCSALNSSLLKAFRPPLLVWMDMPYCGGRMDEKAKIFLKQTQEFLWNWEETSGHLPWLRFHRAKFSEITNKCMELHRNCRVHKSIVERWHPFGKILQMEFDALIFALHHDEAIQRVVDTC